MVLSSGFRVGLPTRAVVLSSGLIGLVYQIELGVAADSDALKNLF